MSRRRLQLRLDRQGGRCFYCACALAVGDRAMETLAARRGEPVWAATRDHFIPLSAGGADSHDNIVCACRPCNEAKRSRMPTLAELVRFVELICVDLPHRTPRAGPLTAALAFQARQADAVLALAIVRGARRRRRRRREGPHVATA